MKNYLLALSMFLSIAFPAYSQGFIPKAPNCAVLYGNANFQQLDYPDPGVFLIDDNQRFEKLLHPRTGSFNDKTSAASVRAGCVLTLYRHDYFREPLQVIEGPKIVTHANGSLYHNDKASSAECICEEDF